MSTNHFSPEEAIQNAAGALRRGDKRAARHWAQAAARIAPQREDPWLILAAVSAAPASIEYIKQALLVNPGSERAMRGLEWAQNQLARQKAPAQVAATSPLSTQPRPASIKPSATQPVRAVRQPARPAQAPRKTQSLGRRLTLPFAILFLLCIIMAWAVLPGSSSLALALIRSQAGSEADGGPAWSQVEIAKPTYTPTVTTTPLPTATPLPTQTPTETATPLPTDTPIQADTQAPTSAPSDGNIVVVGSYTVQAGDTLSNIAQRAGVSAAELANANQISLYATIYAGQILVIPQGGVVPDPATQPAPDPGNPAPTGEKYILVSISQQHLYAYEGNTLVYSFVASTGMNNATRTGLFHVLDKIPNAYGATWNIWMPNWMGIYYAGTLENGIHALPILSNGSRLWAGYLGTPISFGCVVLGVQEAEELYNWADIGTTVEIVR